MGKMEIDPEKFKTNKTGSGGIHHTPLNIYGYPEVPNYKASEKSEFGPKLPSILKRKEKYRNKSASKKPLFKRKPYVPPPVMTHYEPPAPIERTNLKSQEPRKQKPKTRKPHATRRRENPKQKEAMTSLPDALQNLPSFMEKLVGSHANWVTRAWNGRERDESAAA